MNVKNNILLGFAIKSVFYSVITVSVLTATFSKIVMFFDLDDNYCKYLGYIILFISAVIVGVLSTLKFKNSLILMSILSNLPVLILSVINSAANKSFIQILICIADVILASVVASVCNVKRPRKLKV